MPDLGDTLGRQVGPLPLGGWLAVGGGGLGLAWLINRGGSRKAPTTGPVPLGYPVAGPTRAPNDAVVGSTPTGITPRQETVLDWINRATGLVVAEGAATGYLDAQQAIERYTRGMTLDSVQRAIVEQALRLAGAAPIRINLAPDLVDYDDDPPAPSPVPTPPPSYYQPVPIPSAATGKSPVQQYTDRERQVIDAYQAVFGRDPDPTGLAYWTASKLTSDAGIQAALRNTPEGRARAQ